MPIRVLWAERINNSGAGYLTPALLDGQWMVRVSIGVELTERYDVAAIWQLIRSEAEDWPQVLAV